MIRQNSSHCGWVDDTACSLDGLDCFCRFTDTDLTRGSSSECSLSTHAAEGTRGPLDFHTHTDSRTEWMDTNEENGLACCYRVY